MRTKGITLGWLVMAAARKAGRASMRGIVGGAMMAAALVLGMTACSSENDLAGEPKTVEEPTAQTQAATIHVTVGAGITDGEATTRSTVDYNTTTKTRTLTFTGPVGDPGDDGYSAGDRLYVVRALADGKCLAGELTMKGSPAADGTQATFEGELKVYNSEGGEATHDFGDEDPLEGSTATLIHAAMSAEAGDYSFNFETRALTFAAATRVASSVEALMTKGLRVSGGYGASGFALQKATAQPILGCTIAGLTAGATFAMAYSVSADGSTYDDITTGTVTADAQGTATFACLATEEFNDGQASHTNIYHRIRLTNNDDAYDVSEVSLGQKAFESKVYKATKTAVHVPQDIELGSVTTTTHPEGLTLKDGDIVTGTLDAAKSNSKQRLQISIADGATVTLDGVDIKGRNGTSYKWAGLTCLGDATIILAEGSENSVKGFYLDYPGIFIAEGKTLTIQGSGSLTASPYDGGTTNSYGAGIGGANGVACGNIIIEGGSITATGGRFAAGIGGAWVKSCGTISISGGTVTATAISMSAGIGCGNQGTCGAISISGTANVTATCRGESGTVSGTISIEGGTVNATGGTDCAGIGSGKSGTVSGTISITGGTVEATGGSYSSGIGSGKDGSCSDIIIGSDISKVVAKKSGNNSAHIGAGTNGSCGTVTIDGVENATTSSTFTHLTSAVDGNTWTLTNPSN